MMYDVPYINMYVYLCIHPYFQYELYNLTFNNKILINQYMWYN